MLLVTEHVRIIEFYSVTGFLFATIEHEGRRSAQNKKERICKVCVFHWNTPLRSFNTFFSYRLLLFLHTIVFEATQWGHIFKDSTA
jgi:hypothetical protein